MIHFDIPAGELLPNGCPPLYLGMSLTTLNFALLLLALAGRCHNPVCTITFQAVSHLSPSATHFIPSSHFLYSNLSSIPLSHLLYRCVFPQSSQSSPVVCTLLILSGNIHTNSGPPLPSVNAFTLCSFNSRSLLCSAHTTYLTGFAELHTPNIIALTKTWVRNISTLAELINATPPGYSLHSATR